MSAPVVASASAYLATIPSPDRGVWEIPVPGLDLSIPLRAYALCIVAGILVAVWWGNRRWVARGGRPGTVVDVAVWAVPFGLVGGRLYHVATDYDKYFGPGQNPLDIVKVWQGGLGIWGAVALGALGAWLGCRTRRIPLPAFADAVAPGLILAQGIGRLGNWFNQELYGASTDLPWGLEIYRRIDPSTGLADPIGGVALDHTPIAVVHPTFLYELVWNVLVCVAIVVADRTFRMGHGRVFALYVAGYTFGRFFIEMMRTDEATHILGVRINVFTAAAVFLLAAAYLVFVRGRREDPSELRGRPMPGEEDEQDLAAARDGGPSAGGAPADAEQDGGTGTTEGERRSDGDTGSSA